MNDQKLDLLLHDIQEGDCKFAALALGEIILRLTQGRRLSVSAMTALVGGLVAAFEGGKSATFLGAGRRRVGRPKGKGAGTDLVKALQDYGSAKGYLSQGRRTVGERQQQRIRALIRGAPGKPGRPRKSDKE